MALHSRIRPAFSRLYVHIGSSACWDRQPRQLLKGRTEKKHHATKKGLTAGPCELAQEEPPQFPYTVIVEAVRTLAKDLDPREGIHFCLANCTGIKASAKAPKE